MLPERVLAAIRRHQPAPSAAVLLACSGGLDSQVLLHAAAAAWPVERLVVAHVHHGLQPEADEWLAFCEASARRVGAGFVSRRLPALPQRTASGIEAWARRLRYQALAAMAAEAHASLVLTAHHANDQLETHQLRLLRGAGPLGLGAMRDSAPVPGAAHCLLLRPFLGVGRGLIAEYAREHRLEWVDDPSNQDLRHARNRVRRDLAKTLTLDPGGLQRGLDAVGDFQRAADVARSQALEDLTACRVLLAKQDVGRLGAVAAAPPASASLSRAALSRLPEARTAEAIRLWLAQEGRRMPTRARLAEILRQLVQGESPHARLQHDGAWLLRYRDRIDVAADLPDEVETTSFRWSGEPLVDVGGHRFLFERLLTDGNAPSAGIDAQWLAAEDLVMDKARGLDRLRLTPAGRRRTWKNLGQERGIPPWMRSALPVLRRDGEVIHAAPFGTNQDAMTRDAMVMRAGADGAACHARPGRQRVTIEWLAPAHLTRWL